MERINEDEFGQARNAKWAHLSGFELGGFFIKRGDLDVVCVLSDDMDRRKNISVSVLCGACFSCCSILWTASFDLTSHTSIA